MILRVIFVGTYHDDGRNDECECESGLEWNYWFVAKTSNQAHAAEEHEKGAGENLG